MKVILIGATGTLGQAVAEALVNAHEVVRVGHTQGDVTLDMTQPDAIEAMYRKVGRVDAIVVTAGKVHFGELTKMTQEDYQLGLQDKLMGQVNIALLGLDYLTDRGSITLTSGLLNHDPIRFGSGAAMVNGAIDGFVKAAAIEMPHGIRINAVSPTVLVESMEAYGPYFHGFKPVAAADAALAYLKSVDGAQTGQIYRVGYSLS